MPWAVGLGGNNGKMIEAVVRLIAETVGMAALAINEPMSKHTTFKIGGAADLLVEPGSTNQLIALLRLFKRFNIPYFVMGNGSNLLVGDKGIRGAVVKISNELSNCDVSGTTITAQSGIKLSRLAQTALNNGLTGLEFASGIPGTLGGAVYMNAGAYGGEMKDVVKEVICLDTKTESITRMSAAECSFGYRKSIFTSGEFIITGAVLDLAEGNTDEIRAKMNELAARRNEKQPVDKPSAGSTFKRPEGYFAGTMIDECGLKGTRVGGAEVSTKHAGFVVNIDNATAADVIGVIDKVKAEVKRKFGVELEPEVKLVGEF